MNKKNSRGAARSGKKIWLAGILVLFLLILPAGAVVGWYHITAQEPSVDTDYLERINIMTIPDGYAQQDNAAGVLQAAGRAFVPMPASIDQHLLRTPADMTRQQITDLRMWIDDNMAVVELLEEASVRPYLWDRREAEGNFAAKAEAMGPAELVEMLDLLSWYAKLKAAEGEFDISLDILLSRWRIGQLYCRADLLVGEQAMGLIEKRKTLETAGLIIYEFEPDSEVLGQWYMAWEELFAGDDYRAGFDVQMLVHKDLLQRHFTGAGGGERLSYASAEAAGIGAARFARLHIFGPDRGEVEDVIGAHFDYYERAVELRPFEFNRSQAALPGAFSRDWPELSWFLPNLDVFVDYYHMARAQQESLLLVIGLSAYRERNGVYPDGLDVLVSDGYVDRLVDDPFSGEPLVYKVEQGQAKVYSVGPLGVGQVEISDDDPVEADRVFWPVRGKFLGHIPHELPSQPMHFEFASEADN